MSASKSPSRIAVVGAGMLGLMTALRLAQAGREVIVYEAEANAGGLTGTATFGGYQWDRFYHVVLLSDLHTRGLLKELGLEHRLRFGTSRTGFYTDDKLHGMSNAWEFLKFEPLSLIDKTRLAMTISMAGRIRRPERLEKILAIDWLTRWSGKRVVEKIWKPLLKSKLGDNYRHASAAFIWAIIARLYAARRSGLKREQFGVIDGGYAIVVHALLRRLDELGVAVRTGTPIKTVRGAAPHVMIETQDGDVAHFDEVVMTVAPVIAQALCPELQPAEKKRLANVPYQGGICAALLLKKPLSPYYVTNLTDGNMPFTGVIEMTALMGTQTFGGNSLVYLPLYLPQEAAEWKLSAGEIRDRFYAGLEKMHPGFDRSDVLDCKLSRARRVLPISTLNYSRDVMPPVSTSVPHIHFVNAARIAYGTLNVNETLAPAQQHVEDVLRVTHAAPPAVVAPNDRQEPRIAVTGFGPDVAADTADKARSAEREQTTEQGA